MAGKEKRERIDATREFLNGIQASVYRRQKKLLSVIKGKLVVRNRIMFKVLQVSQKSGVVIVHQVGEEGSYLRMNARSFLYKRIRIVGDEI